MYGLENILPSGVVARIPALLLSLVSELIKFQHFEKVIHTPPSRKAVVKLHLILSVMALVEALVAPELDINVDNNK